MLNKKSKTKRPRVSREVKRKARADAKELERLTIKKAQTEANLKYYTERINKLRRD